MRINLRLILAVLIGIMSFLPIAEFWIIYSGAGLAALLGGNFTIIEILFTIVPPFLASSLISFAIADPSKRDRIKAAIFTFIGIILFGTVWMLMKGSPLYLYLYNVIFYEAPQFFSRS